MKHPKMRGFIRWYNVTGDHGIITNLDTKESYYFNSWSFQKTHYVVTGISKATGCKKSIKTRLFPGLFLDRKHVKDPICYKKINEIPVEFEQAQGLNYKWAANIKINKKFLPEVLEYHLFNLLEQCERDEQDERLWYRNIWCRSNYSSSNYKSLHDLIEIICKHPKKIGLK